MNEKITVLPIDAIKKTIMPSAAIPVAHEIESVVLGILLCESSFKTQQAMMLLSVESFSDPVHKIIFNSMRVIESKGSKIDLYSIGQQLKTEKNLEAIGGLSRLVSLTQLAGSGVYLEQNVRLLIDNQIGRQLALNGYRTMCQILDGADISEVIAEAQSDIEKATTVGFVDSKQRHISDIVEDVITETKKLEQNAKIGKVTGITTGLRDLDRMTNGWQAGQLIILAARPAMGKTALMLHFAVSAALSGVPVQIYSLEMGSVSLVKRLFLSQCDVDANSFRSGRDIYWNEVEKGASVLKMLPIHIDEKAAVSMKHIATHSKIMHRKGQCELIFIDYLQLINTRSVGRNREQEVAECSRMAKELAKELGVPVIMLAQLSRAVEGRGGSKKPMLSDLRESGAIEQDADIVLFPHRPEYYETNKTWDEITLSNGSKIDVPLKGLGEILIAKQRDGATGFVRFTYNDSVSKFYDFDERKYLDPNYTPIARNTYESRKNDDDDMPF